MEARLRENDLFEDTSWKGNFKIVIKLPYDFYYKFEDTNNRRSRMKILDWEIGALYWNCLHRASGDRDIAIQKVREKFEEEFIETDLHFFVGTTLRYHGVSDNPFTIVGVFSAPYASVDLLDL